MVTEYRLTKNFGCYEILTTGNSVLHKQWKLLTIKKKNRYANVLPLNTNRVHLVEKQGETDYINASYITGPHRTKEYIATQGPLANTSSDFWLMILENNVTIVVMLTNVSENGMKCHPYWPSTDEKIKRFADSKVTVEFLSQEPVDVKKRYILGSDKILCIKWKIIE